MRVEKCSPDEVQGLLASAAAFLSDARRRENSEATRFNIAYEAAHALALAALRANDLRPAQGPGHRAIVFNVLDATTTAPTSISVPLAKAHDKRNKLTYDGLATFSRTELQEYRGGGGLGEDRSGIARAAPARPSGSRKEMSRAILTPVKPRPGVKSVS